MIQKIKFLISKIIVAVRYINFRIIIHYILKGKEISNFTYPIKNKNEIIHLIHNITGCNYDKINELMNEINFNNPEIKNFFSKKYFDDYKNPNILGRRIIWYLLIRIIKPSIVIESGVFQGIGAALLCYAIYKNKKDSNKIQMKYIGLDIKLKVDYLNINAHDNIEAIFHQIDSLEFLKNFNDKGKIIYISDAKHETEFEKKEFELIQKNFLPGSLIISDNGSEALSEFSIQKEKKLICFTEDVEDHWYPGAKCCVSYRY